MNKVIVPLAAVVAGIVLVIGAMSLLRAPAGVGQQPSAASASPCDMAMSVGAKNSLTNCSFHSTIYKPTVTIPGAPFMPVDESAHALQLNATLPGGVSNQEGLAFLTLESLATKPCQTTSGMSDTSTTPFHPTAAQDVPSAFFDWVRTTAGLDVSTPTPSAIGGFSGLEATVTIPDGGLATCNGQLWLTWLGADAGSGSGQYALAFSGLTWHLGAYDVGGRAVIVQWWGPPARFATVDAAVRTLVSTLRFTAGS